MPKVAKAYAINNARISFVSLVDKAANKHTFLVTKGDDGKANFQTYGDILEAVKKADDAHYVTGIVYEPMVEDTQGNYMTEEEITKAAYWYAENGNNVDIQHSFEPIEGAKVVESYIAKSDEEINGKPVKKGSWVMTMKIEDPEIFDAIQKGDITGFSMGGRGDYSTEDVQLPESDSLEKSSAFQNIRKQVASIFGFDGVVAKGAVKARTNEQATREIFNDAYWALADELFDKWNPITGEWGKNTDPTEIETDLSDFVDIARQLLNQGDIIKSLSGGTVEKAGKAMSKANVEKLRSVYDSLGTFLSNFEESEDEEVTKADVEQITKAVTEAVTKAMNPATAQKATEAAGEAVAPTGEGTSTDGVAKAAQGGTEPTQALTTADVQKMVNDAVAKAMAPKAEEVTPENIESVVKEAVAKAMEPVLKSAGLPTNLNGSNVQKNDGEDECYLHGIL